MSSYFCTNAMMLKMFSFYMESFWILWLKDYYNEFSVPSFQNYCYIVYYTLKIKNIRWTSVQFYVVAVYYNIIMTKETKVLFKLCIINIVNLVIASVMINAYF